MSVRRGGGVRIDGEKTDRPRSLFRLSFFRAYAITSSNTLLSSCMS